MNNVSTSNLFQEFPRSSREEWEKRIEQDLNSEDDESQLKWTTTEGLEILPFYMSEDIREVPHLRPAPGRYPFTRGNTGKADWLISEQIYENDPVKARQKIIKLLEQDVNLIQFNLQAVPNEKNHRNELAGLNIQSIEDFKELTRNIELNETGLIIDSGMISPAVFAMMKSQMNVNNQAFFTFDPYTFTARFGRLPIPEKRIHSVILQFADEPVRSLCADGLFYQRCGATLVQELAISLAIGSEYLAAAIEQGSNPDAICKSFWMRLSTGSLYFPEIAKFRAARMLWSKITDAYGLPHSSAKQLHIHAETTPWNKTTYASHTNMLRVTTETMSAIIGGANSVQVLPYNFYHQPSDPFSSRIARNVHHILKHESFLNKVTDPAAGCWYVEKITDQIADKAWSFFQWIEKQGGFLKALEAGKVQSAITESKNKKTNALAHRNIISLGTNHYPDPGDEPPDNLYPQEPADSFQKTDSDPEINPENIIHDLQQAFTNGSRLGDIIDSLITNRKQQDVIPLSTSRLTLPFERLRKATEEFEKMHGKRPGVLLLPVGNKKIRNARADFSRNVFGCAGYEIHENTGYDTLQKATKDTETLSQSPDIVVLCSPDEEYPRIIEPFCEAFKNTGALLVAAGNPVNNINSYRKSGIKYFIHSESNILDLLTSIQKELGVIKPDTL